ncbi:MAG: methylated-DNA--[protein]-cysteine S-methyltransferase [Chloroflexi bacterium]|nr:methylated-DNA--[protein]-cysteine S-methyltransferase [Chloroflexota bacterium]MYB21170.1 methylated-DNA--[protein]-cysteine S-methyltransferase [Chloroflexota bacterium]MYD17802.1 methylated-DNA--[protein]-cysteine S-methyltransferase [Chloroflexota bacterium]MYF81841.1 methylated-DNA--[protein]-cysteine S-methyltransferase [Chloroflexota bacterium]MYI05727.1 methylated-DNA--[protein]-cysteine S-methyltransferase [Chloroflexota bacterium]
MTEHCWIETQLGTMYLAIADGALREAGFVETWARPVLEPDPESSESGLSPQALRVRDAVAAYFEGDVEAIDEIAIDPQGTDFQRAVWQAIREVPAGRTVSYQDIARAVGKPAAYRAVGTATGRNPVGIAVPCHRIVRADGGLGGYGGGLHRKEWFLEHERTHLPVNGNGRD